MYADRIEAEERSVRTRLGDGSGSERALGGALGVRGRVSFKRSTGGGGGGRPKSRSDTDEKWKHDLFEEVESFLGPEGSTDLRALLASKQQTKLGGQRLSLSSRLSLLSAQGAVETPQDLRSQLDARTPALRQAGKPAARRKSLGDHPTPVAVQAARRLTVMLQNERGVEEGEEEEEQAGRGREERPAIIRGGRGSLIVTSNLEDGQIDEMETEDMPGQVPLQTKKTQKTTFLRSSVAQPQPPAMPLSGFLHSLGLAKYSTAFEEEEIDMAALRQMTEEDLKELGIPMGPRKKILQAAAAS